MCTSWLGSEVEGDFQFKIQRFLKKFPESVQNEYADHISQSNSGVRIDELTMQWTDFESLIQIGWESSMIKEIVRSGFVRPLDIVVPTQVTYDLPPSYAAAAASRATPAVVDHFKKIDGNKINAESRFLRR